MQVENPIFSATTATASSGTAATESRSALMKDDFLKLLVSQLKNQDPLNPADNQEFAAQLAQFSSLEQLMQMNQSLEKNLDSNSQIITYLHNSKATDFIGKEVRAVGDQVSLGESGDAVIRFSQEANSQDTMVNIYNESGAMVRSLDIGSRPAGGMNVTWDGKDSEDKRLSAGVYRFEVAAVDYEGNEVGTTGFMIGTVTGVRYQDNKASLLVGEEEVELENVIEVVQPEEK
jgi:flagellar basal-body rod modification protein FlgD